jgi:hypothetical protein
LELPHVLEAGDPPPASLRLSAEVLRRDGAFLLDDGLALRLWIGRECKQTLLDALLTAVVDAGAPGEANPADAQPLARRASTRVLVRGDLAPPLEAERDGGIGAAFAGLIDLLRDTNAWLHQPLLLAREGVDAGVCADFLSLLIEDRSANVFSYYEFLVQVNCFVIVWRP